MTDTRDLSKTSAGFCSSCCRRNRFLEPMHSPDRFVSPPWCVEARPTSWNLEVADSAPAAPIAGRPGPLRGEILGDTPARPSGRSSCGSTRSAVRSSRRILQRRVPTAFPVTRADQGRV